MTILEVPGGTSLWVQEVRGTLMSPAWPAVYLQVLLALTAKP
jgi:hypothetical protein